MAIRYRLIALDADGTALDPEGRVRPVVRAALDRARDRGIRVVLCTGRRTRRALPVLQALGATSEPAIVHNGVLVIEPKNGEVLERSLLPGNLYHAALGILSKVGRPLVYSADGAAGVDFFSEPLDRIHPYQREYVAAQHPFCAVVESLETPPCPSLVMLSCMADAASLETARAEVLQTLGNAVRTHLLRNRGYPGSILEIAAAGSGKWNALQRLAARAGIAPHQILAIGDDENDAEMIAHSGLGIAMADAPASVRQQADWIAPTSDQDGVAVALERFVLD